MKNPQLYALNVTRVNKKKKRNVISLNSHEALFFIQTNSSARVVSEILRTKLSINR